jgi:nucleotide-binding universal stress UspA family protein
MTTKNILVPIDGSQNALRALKHAADRIHHSSHSHLLLLNVQPALPSSRHVPRAMINEHHAQMAEEALAPARRLAERLGVSFDCYSKVGDAATVISTFAEKTRCAEIIMGTRGLGRMRGLLLGSVATKVISLAKAPVTLVK